MSVKNLFLFTFSIMVACSSCEKDKVEPTTTTTTTPTTSTGTPAFNVTVTTFAGDSAQRGSRDDTDPLKARFLNPKKLISALF